MPKDLLNQLMRDDAEVGTMLREGYDPEIRRFSVERVDLNLASFVEGDTP